MMLVVLVLMAMNAMMAIMAREQQEKKDSFHLMQLVPGQLCSVLQSDQSRGDLSQKVENCEESRGGIRTGSRSQE